MIELFMYLLCSVVYLTFIYSEWDFARHWLGTLCIIGKAAHKACDVTCDIHRAQPKDTLQFCSNRFQARLEESAPACAMPPRVAPLSPRVTPPQSRVDTPRAFRASCCSQPHARNSCSHYRPSIHTNSNSPFGTLNASGNALLAHAHNSPQPNAVASPTIPTLQPTSR